MEKDDFTDELKMYIDQVESSARNRKVVDNTTHEGWDITCYFGPKPGQKDDVPSLSFSACGTTKDYTTGKEPDLNDLPSAVRVDYDKASVVWVFADTKSLLTRKLKKAFKGFNWNGR